jgi:hypothetical protein
MKLVCQRRVEYEVQWEPTCEKLRQEQLLSYQIHKQRYIYIYIYI